MTYGDLRVGEIATSTPQNADATLSFIGVIRTPWLDRAACPRKGDVDGPVCQIVVDEHWIPALEGIEENDILEVVYWMHLARRNLLRQNPKSRDELFGTFALRSPVRPNPIAVSAVKLLERHGGTLLVRGLDCIDGTPLLDLKPSRCPMWPCD